jgi:hypothetical protein
MVPDCGTASEQPASYAGDILVVGAWNTYNNDIAFFSSRGPSPLGNRLAPNIIASGSAVMSAVKSGKDIYGDKTGTSMASPPRGRRGGPALVLSPRAYRPAGKHHGHHSKYG